MTVNKLRLAALILTLVAAVTAVAQVPAGFTGLTFVVADSTGAVWAGGTYLVQFVDPGTSGQLPLLNGNTFQKVYAGLVLDSFGRGSINLPDNNVIASSSGATGTQWDFSVSDSTNKCHFNLQLTVTGPTMDPTSAMASAAPILTSCRGGGGGGGGTLLGSGTPPHIPVWTLP